MTFTLLSVGVGRRAFAGEDPGPVGRQVGMNRLGEVGGAAAYGWPPERLAAALGGHGSAGVAALRSAVRDGDANARGLAVTVYARAGDAGAAPLREATRVATSSRCSSTEPGGIRSSMGTSSVSTC